MTNISLSFFATIKDVRSVGRLSANIRRLFEAAVKERSEEILSSIENAQQSKDKNLLNKEAKIHNIYASLNSFVDDCLNKITTGGGRQSLSPQELEELNEALLDCLKELQKKFTPLLVDMEDKKVELINQKKWLAFRFPEAALTTSPDCVQFVMQSGLGYYIEMFKNTTPTGLSRHDIQFDGHEVRINMDGVFEPWSKIKQQVEFDKTKNQIVSRERPNESYTYISPKGLVNKSRHPNELYPVEELDAADHRLLKSHAQRFWQGHPEVDPGVAKECILQVVTSKRNCLPDNWITENLNKLNPQHTAIRLIDKDGRVYSFGITLTQEFEKYAQDNPFSFLATGYSKVVTPDYQESRHTFDERAVTSIPLTQTRMDAILQRAKEANEGNGMRFCILKQNCNKFGVNVLGLAGIHVDTRTSIGEMLSATLPKLEKVPGVGAPLAWLKNKIKRVVEPVFATLNTYTPSPIKKVISFTVSALLYIPGKINTVFLNTIIIFFGGMSEVQKQRPEIAKNESMNAHKIIAFTSLITWWGDIFDDEKSECNHSYKLAEWQRRQATTEIVRYSQQLKMHILPQPNGQ